MEFMITSPVSELGLTAVYAVVRGVDNHAAADEWIAFREARLAALLEQYAELDYRADERLEGYNLLHDRAGVKRRKNVPSVENLIRMLRRHGTLPIINPVVDIYNLISVESRLCIAAHDLDRITGGVTVKFPAGTERYIPLGQTEAAALDAHEYYYCDDAGDVLCRMELHQGSKTVVTPEVRNLLFILEGHDRLPPQLLEATAWKLVDAIVQYCGGAGTVCPAGILQHKCFD